VVESRLTIFPLNRFADFFTHITALLRQQRLSCASPQGPPPACGSWGRRLDTRGRRRPASRRWRRRDHGAGAGVGLEAVHADNFLPAAYTQPERLGVLGQHLVRSPIHRRKGGAHFPLDEHTQNEQKLGELGENRRWQHRRGSAVGRPGLPALAATASQATAGASPTPSPPKSSQTPPLALHVTPATPRVNGYATQRLLHVHAVPP
jgi:hypothetical protein